MYTAADRRSTRRGRTATWAPAEGRAASEVWTPPSGAPGMTKRRHDSDAAGTEVGRLDWPRCRSEVGPGAPREPRNVALATQWPQHGGETSGTRAPSPSARGVVMEVLYERCAGLDVHKNLVVACARIA